MEITTLAELKAHCRIDDNLEDSVVEAYGNAAEQYVLTYTGRSLSELRSLNAAVNGERAIPPMIKQAVWLLAGHFYKTREASGNAQTTSLPFALEAMLRPFTSLVIEREVDDA